MDVRRVVTGHGANGQGVFASDEWIGPIELSFSPGGEFHWLWGGDAAPRFPDDGSQPRAGQYFPPVDGYRFGFVTIPPGEPPAPDDIDPEAVVAEFEQKLPGMARYMDLEHPGFHMTPTIDFEVVLSGRLRLELEHGDAVELGPGDTVVMNGARHKWTNPGDVPAVYAVFMCGAHHEGFA